MSPELNVPGTNVPGTKPIEAGFLKLAPDSFADWNTPAAGEAFRDL